MQVVKSVCACRFVWIHESTKVERPNTSTIIAGTHERDTRSVCSVPGVDNVLLRTSMYLAKNAPELGLCLDSG
jgi:hypothetical protein